jgi:(p)ppGpp synthase/HD superfamily hydrolase
MGVIESFPEIYQAELITNLESKLTDVKSAVNSLISYPDELNRFLLPYMSSASKLHEAAALEDALVIAHTYYSSGEHSIRDNGDNYLVHPVQAAVILTEVGMDLYSRIAELLHDVFENNPHLTEQIIAKIKEKNLGESLQYIYPMTPPEGITDSRHKKELLQKAIINAGSGDPQKKLYGIRVADRLTNLPTLDYFKPKEGRTPEERKQGVIDDTRKNILPLAYEFDKVSGAELRLHGYMSQLLSRYKPQSDSMTSLTESPMSEMNYFQRARLALSNYF